jgi:hypothetical protein
MSFRPFSIALDNKPLSIKSKRSQSALEYMMTYGWAILIIVIVAVILYSMGIFNPSSSITTTITGFQSLGVTQANCINSVNNQILELYITNKVGYPINITSINVTGNNGLKVTQVVGSILNPGASSSFYVNGACNKSSSFYSGSATITYTEPGQPLTGPYVSTGSLVKVPVTSNPNTVASFNGASSFINITLPQEPVRSATRTALVWFYDKNTALKAHAFSYGCGGGSCGGLKYFTVYVASGVATLNAYYSNQGMYPQPIQNNTWYLLVYEYNGTSQIGYIDYGGVIYKVYANENYNTTYTPLYLGCEGNDNGAVCNTQFWQGYLSDFQLYTSALSENRIESIYSRGLGSAPMPNSGLVGWFPLDGNANDYSGNNNNGVATAVNWVSP